MMHTMTQFVENSAVTGTRRKWVTGLAAVGLVAAAWVTIAHIPPDENLAGDAVLRAVAEAAGRNHSSAGSQSLNSLDGAIEFLQLRRENLEHMADYTAVFAKTEFVNERLISQTMDLKFRRQPFSVYVRAHSKRRPAREAIFVTGRDDDRLTLHEAGLKSLITLHLKPDDARIMAENRYPITDIGMARMLDIVLAIWDQEKHIDPANVDVQFSPATRFGSSECEEIRVTHKLRLTGLKFHSTRVAFDLKTGFPVILEQCDWPFQPGEEAPLVEQYLYSDVQANPGLTDADFDPENSDYNFSFASIR